MPTHRPTVPISLPLLVLLPLTLLFSLLTLAFASRTLSLFNSQQTTNPWLLPLWRGHFDLRGLQLVVGTSAAIVLLDGVAMLVMLLSFLGLLKTATLLPTLPTVIATTSLLSTLLALPATILPLVLNNRAPTRDTLQSWTCGWISRGVRSQDGLPGDFGRFCGESRFATYAPVVLLVLHLGILALALLALKQARGSLMMKSRGRSAGASAARGEEDGEKMIELGEYEKMPRDKA